MGSLLIGAAIGGGVSAATGGNVTHGAIGGAILGPLGGVVAGQFERFSGASGTRNDAQSLKNIAEYNAKVAEQEGKSARARAGFAAGKQADKAQRDKSSQIAALGAAGAVGSSIDVNISREQEKISTLDNLLIGYEGEVLSLRAGNAATLARLQGEAGFMSGQSRATSQNIGFGIQLAGLASNFLPSKTTA